MIKTIKSNLDDVPTPIYSLIVAYVEGVIRFDVWRLTDGREYRCAGFCSAMMASRPIPWPLPNPSNLDRGLKMMEADHSSANPIDKTM